MTRRPLFALSSALFASALLMASASYAETESWTIAERKIPAPAAASEQLKQSIASTPAPNIMMSRLPFQGNKAINWKAMVSQQAANADASTQQLLDSLDITVKNDSIAGVNVYHVHPKSIDPRFKDKLFIYVHGGAYVFGGGLASVSEAAVIATTANINVLSVDYRMPPDHPFPAAVDDVLAVYGELLKTTAPHDLAIGGTSAGGGLSLAAIHKFKSSGLAVPAALYVGTPWADLSKTSDTLFTNEGLDRVLVTYDGALKAAAELYADGRDLKHPLISPVYGEFDGFPPTYLVTGTRDMLLSDTARVHRKLKIAGVATDMNVYEGMSHAGYAFNFGAPEHQQTYAEMTDFLLQHLAN